MTQNKDYKSAYEAVEKIMLNLKTDNYLLLMENMAMKKRLAKYEPEAKPKEAEFIDAMNQIMGE